MEVYNEDKTIKLTEYDLTKGKLIDSTLRVLVKEAQEEVQQKSHIELVKEYENGGREFKEVVDIPYQPKTEAIYEEQPIQIYHEYTPQEIAIYEYNDLTQWFDFYFDKQLIQSLWQSNFKISHDNYFNKDYSNVEELKAQAEVVRQRIKVLEGEIK